MSNHLITEILKIEEEADRIVNEARKKASDIVSRIPAEIEIVKTHYESEYCRKREILKATIRELQKAGEDDLRNKSKVTKEKLIRLNDKTVEDAVGWIIKHIYES